MPPEQTDFIEKKAQPIAPHLQETTVPPTNPHLQTLRTYRADVEATIHTNNESVVSIASAEARGREKDIFTTTDAKKFRFTMPHMFGGATSEGQSGTNKENVLLTYGVLPLVGVLLFIVGGGIVFAVYKYTHTQSTQVVIPQAMAILPYTTKKDIDVSKGTIHDQIFGSIVNQTKSYNGVLGGFLFVNLLKGQTPLSATEFFSDLAPGAPGTLGRSIGDKYMTGVYSGTINTPFIVLTSSDYGQTYSGLLAWETTMQHDMAGYFPGVVAPALTTTPRSFEDDTFNNHDVRILRDDSGKIVLVYGFFDKNTFAITSNETVFQSLMTKYLNTQLVH